MKEENEIKNWEEYETEEISIEALTEIQGGLDDEETGMSRPCGLGCILGAGY